MNELEILTLLRREKELFFKCDIEYIINNSSKIDIHDIYDLTFENKLFNLDNIKKDLYYCILIVIIDKEKKVLETRTINRLFKDGKIKFNLKSLENKQVLDNYDFYISVIPIIEKNKNLVKNFIKYYFPSKVFNNKILNNKFQIFSVLVLLFSFCFTLFQIHISNILIENYGQVDSIVNNISIFNSIVSYFYDVFFVKKFFILLVIYLYMLSLFMIPSIIIFCFEFIPYVFRLVFSCNKNERLYSYIRFINSLKDIKFNFIDIYSNPNFLFKYSLFYFFLILLLVIPTMKLFMDSNIKNNFNIKAEIIQRYSASSVFPSFIEIKEGNKKSKKIFAIGYDVNYLYYYDYKYIKDILNKDFKSFDNSKYETKEMDISEVYAYYLNNLSKKELKYIKVTDYKIERTLPDKYYEINKK